METDTMSEMANHGRTIATKTMGVNSGKYVLLRSTGLPLMSWTTPQSNIDGGMSAPTLDAFPMALHERAGRLTWYAGSFRRREDGGR